MTDQSLITSLATLARLKLTADEAAAFSEQIPRILAYVDQLKNVEETAVADNQAACVSLRPDVMENSGQADDIIAQAPDHVDRFWKVPPVK